MSHKTLEKWLKECEPKIPAPFLLHLQGVSSGPAGVENLISFGEGALSRALRKTGRKRAAAFDLLAADAFLTYACEAMATGGDVPGSLEALLKRIGERFR
jgi:hypothetical protein